MVTLQRRSVNNTNTAPQYRHSNRRVAQYRVKPYILSRPQYVVDVSLQNMPSATMNQVTDICKFLASLTEKERAENRAVVETLHSLASEVDKQVLNARIAKTSFATTGIVGSGLAIAGVIAAPFTFGASLGLTIAGAVVGVSSGVGGLTTTIVDKILNSSKNKEAKTATSNYMHTLDQIVIQIEQIKKDWNPQTEHAFMQAIQNISDVDASRSIKSIIQSIKTTDKVGGAAARVTAAAAAIAAKTTVAAAARTVAGVVKTGLFAAKIGGAVVSAILIPVDVFTIYKNSKAIHNKKESDAAKHIRKLATEIQAIQIFPTSEINSMNPSDTGLDEARDLRRQLKNLQKKVSKTAAESEAAERERQRIEYKQRRQISNISEAVLTALEKIPQELTQLSNSSTKTISRATQLKLVCCFLELAGCIGLICHTVAVVAGAGSATVENASQAVIIIGGVTGLVAELYSEMFHMYRWREAVSVVDKYLFAAITLCRVRAGEGDEVKEDEIRERLARSFDDINQHKITVLRILKTLIDILSALLLGRTELTAVGQQYLGIEGSGAAYTLALGGPMTTAVGFLLDQVDAEHVIESFKEIGVGGSLLLLLTSTITLYIGVVHWRQWRRDQATGSTTLSDEILLLSFAANMEAMEIGLLEDEEKDQL